MTPLWQGLRLGFHLGDRGLHAEEGAAYVDAEEAVEIIG
jgi:hypothetical protein